MFWNGHTKDPFFLKVMRKVLEDMPEITWNLEREMVGLGLGDWPHMLPDSGDDEIDNKMGHVYD